jgi:2-polyprenyl-3-methyl-5-hydroxy-6-metoxy-1,4-benzoquinol methylase
MKSILRFAMIVAALLATLGWSATAHENTIRAESADDRLASERHVHEEHAPEGQVHVHLQDVVDPERAAELARRNEEYDRAWAAWLGRFSSSGDFAPRMTVADLGAGAGELVALLARRVGDQGRVFANEIDKEKLQETRELCEQEDLSNVTMILGSESDPRLPPGQTDVAVMVEVLHHLTDPGGFLEAVRDQLKPGGKVIIVEPNAKTTEQLEGCYSDPHKSRELAAEVGFEFERIDWFTITDLEFFALVLRTPDAAGVTGAAECDGRRRPERTAARR